MKTSPALDSKLERLAQLAKDLSSESAQNEFRKALFSQNHTIIARAAQLAARARAYVLIPSLIEAFARLIAMPAASDKGCTAKSAIVRALDQLDCQLFEPFVLGARHVQMEPAFGEPIDTAADLRGECAIVLAQKYYPDIYFLVLDLMFDKEPKPRLAAATILGAVPSETNELMLRMKLRLPEADSGVVQKCFSGLLSVNAERSWPFVEEFLRSSDSQKAECAALAIGESRDERAFDSLKAAAEENPSAEFRRIAFLAMMLTRNDEAITYLVGQVKTAGQGTAILALEALSVSSDDTRMRRLVFEAADSRQNRQIDDAFSRFFGG